MTVIECDMMAEKPLILLTNDDGIDSPGLLAAAEAVASLGDILVAAPHDQQTGAGRSFIKLTDHKIYRTASILIRKHGEHADLVAAMLAEKVENPVRVVTPAGDIEVRWEDGVTLEGPAELTARGEYHWSPGRG